MTPLWTLGEVAAATGGVPHGDATLPLDDVASDSREAARGTLFVALAGTRSDGHEHWPAAREAGAAAALVSRAVEGAHVRVPETMAALGALAAAARDRAPARRLGITGSVGKTTLRHMAEALFAQATPDGGHASRASLNNHVGVPLTLARMPRETRLAAFEMGMNHGGELAALTRLVRPHVALVTWVAAAHLGHFQDEQGIAAAKAEMLEGLEPGGIAVLPRGNRHWPLLAAKAREVGATIVTFDLAEGADVHALRLEEHADGTDLVARVGPAELACRVALPGRHMALNALGLIASAHALGLEPSLAGVALGGLSPLPGRGRRVEVGVRGGRAALIDESYNANPASMEAALALLAAAPARRRLAVLGDMRELGGASPALHAALAGPIAAARVDALCLVGHEMAALDWPGAARTADADEALAWAHDALRPGDVLLVKGSNGIDLARVVAGLMEVRP